MQKCGIHFIHASDEWYLLAEEELPQEDSYDGYIQLENGVGMLRLLRTEFAEALAEAQQETCKDGAAQVQQEACKDGAAQAVDNRETASIVSRVTVATGLLAAPTICELAQKFMEVFPQIEIQVIPIVNRFFGEQITVSGLLTGQDIVEQLRGRNLGGKLLLPCNLLRSGEEVFLDDMTLAQVENALQVEVDIVKSSGQDLVSCLLDDYSCRNGIRR